MSGPNFLFYSYRLRYGCTPNLAQSFCISIQDDKVYFTKRDKKHFTPSSFRRWIPFSLGNVWRVLQAAENDCLWRVNRLSFPQLQNSMGILYTLVHSTEIRAETVPRVSPGRVRQSWVKCQLNVHIWFLSLQRFTALLYSLIAHAQWQLNYISQQKHSRWCFLLAQWSRVQTSKRRNLQPQWGT